MYFQGESLAALWLTVDAMDFDRQIIEELRAAAAEATGTAPEHTHILTTHNHGGSTCDEMDHARLCDCAATAARLAQAAAVPALVRSCVTRPAARLNYLRRIHVPEADGTTTFFYGPCADNQYDTAPFLDHYLRSLADGTLAYTGASSIPTAGTPFPPADDRIFLMQFAEKGTLRPLGSILRFAAHAVCCNRPGVASADYPGYARAELARRFGGVAIFLNGPCADIAPGIPRKCAEAGERLGTALATLALDAIGDTPFAPLTSLDDRLRDVPLPVADDVREDGAPLPAELPPDLPGRKRLLEARRRRDTIPFLRDKYRNGEPAPGATHTVRLGLLRLNQTIFLAFPGETFSTTASAVAGDDADVVTVTEHDRTAMYIPPEAEYRLGGYESTCALTAPGAESILRRAARGLLFPNREAANKE